MSLISIYSFLRKKKKKHIRYPSKYRIKSLDDILLNVLSCVVTVVVIILTTLLGSKLIKWVSNKIDNEKTEKYIAEVTTIVLDAIKCVFQNYVEALKKKGNFRKNSKLTALNKAKDIVLSQLSKDNKTTSRLTLMMSIPGLPPRLRQA